MQSGSEHIDDLIAKVIAGEASQKEEEALEEWVKLSPENLVYLEESKKLFKAIDEHREVISVDTHKAWQKVDSRINNSGGKVISLFSRGNMIRAAASFLLLITLGFLMYRVMYDQDPAPIKIMASQKMVKKRLPDGSKIFLNKNSEIIYKQNEDIREIELKGEAYFEVKHNEEIPFQVVIEELVIKDIGTAFNVKAIPGSNVVIVSVDEGEVEITYRGSEPLTLVKGERALFDKGSRKFSKDHSMPLDNIGSYRSRIFHFSEENLREVVTQINEVYGSDIQLNTEALGNCRISVLFNDEKLDVIVSVIAETLDLEIHKEGETILLKGQPCN